MEEGVDEKLVEELVTDSYLLVVSGLPKAEQPVDPHTYGTGTRAAGTASCRCLLPMKGDSL